MAKALHVSVVTGVITGTLILATSGTVGRGPAQSYTLTHQETVMGGLLVTIGRWKLELQTADRPLSCFGRSAARRRRSPRADESDDDSDTLLLLLLLLFLLPLLGSTVSFIALPRQPAAAAAAEPAASIYLPLNARISVHSPAVHSHNNDICTINFILFSNKGPKGLLQVATKIQYYTVHTFILAYRHQCSNYVGGELAPLVQALPQTPIIGLRSALAIRPP